MGSDDNNLLWFAHDDYLQIPYPKTTVPFFAWIIPGFTNIGRYYGLPRELDWNLSLSHLEQRVITKMNFHIVIMTYKKG